MKRTLFLMVTVIALALGSMSIAMAGVSSSGNAANSLGKTTFDTNVNDGNNMDYGSGIPDGQWMTAEVQGVVIGLRAMERFEGHLPISAANGNRVAVYEATTGLTSGDNNGTWNYEFHVDLSGATGNAEGKKVSDYNLSLEQDFTEQSLFGLLGSDPIQLPMPDVCYGDDYLCQQSWNPGFGTDDYNPYVEGIYNLRLILTPSTFNGPPLAVKIQVNVSSDYNIVGDWVGDFSGNDRWITIETQVDGDLDGIFGVGTVPGTSETGTITGTIDGQWVTMHYERTDIVTDYTADLVGILADDGNSMSGTWTDSNGNGGNWSLARP